MLSAKYDAVMPTETYFLDFYGTRKSKVQSRTGHEGPDGELR
jgi:hypothetical protein